MAKAVKRVVRKQREEIEETPSSTKRLVSLLHGPKIVVDAVSDDHAWKKYKSIAGIIQSDHQPTIQELDEDHDLVTDENGVVIEAPAKPAQAEADLEE